MKTSISSEQAGEFNKVVGRLKADGSNTTGLTQLITLLHLNYDLSYREIAKLANISSAGLRRWRSNGYGKTSLVELFLQRARAIVEGEPLKPESSSSLASSFKTLATADIETGLNGSFAKLLDENFNGCSVNQITIEDKTVKLEVVVR